MPKTQTITVVLELKDGQLPYELVEHKRGFTYDALKQFFEDIDLKVASISNDRSIYCVSVFHFHFHGNGSWESMAVSLSPDEYLRLDETLCAHYGHKNSYRIEMMATPEESVTQLYQWLSEKGVSLGNNT